MTFLMNTVYKNCQLLILCLAKMNKVEKVMDDDFLLKYKSSELVSLLYQLLLEFALIGNKIKWDLTLTVH